MFSSQCANWSHIYIITGLEGPPNQRGKYVLSNPSPPKPKNFPSNYKIALKVFVQLE